jgi:hypothetical protein
VSIATEPELTKRDNVTTSKDDTVQHVDAEKSDEVAAPNDPDHHPPIPSIERRCHRASQRSEQRTKSLPAKSIVETDQGAAPTSAQNGIDTHTDAIKLNEAVASAPTSSHQQNTIIASIEGKSL